MLATARAKDPLAYVEWLRAAAHEKSSPATSRARAAASCLALAQDHHHAIVVLFEHYRLFASGFALLRVEFEAYVRGTWLALSASEAQVERFLDAEEPPSLRVMLQELELNPAFADKVLSSVKQTHWQSMCAYTHTGGLHVQRWNTESAVEPNYSQSEIEEVLAFAELLSSLAVIGVLELGGHLKEALGVFESFQRRAA